MHNNFLEENQFSEAQLVQRLARWKIRRTFYWVYDRFSQRLSQLDRMKTHLRETSLTAHLSSRPFGPHGGKRTRRRRLGAQAAAQDSAEFCARGVAKPRRSCRSESAEQLIMNSAETGSRWDWMHAAPLCSEESRDEVQENSNVSIEKRKKNNLFSQIVFTLFIQINRKALLINNRCLAPSDTLSLSSHKCWFTKQNA